MHDTRIALVKKALTQIKAANAALGTTHLGNSLIIWNSYVTFAVDVNDIELTDVTVDPGELKKAFKAKMGFMESVDVASSPFDDSSPSYDEPVEQLNGGGQSIVDAWTDDLTAMATIFNAYNLTRLHVDRPNLARIARVESGYLCVTNGYMMFEAATSLPEGFHLPGRLAGIVGALTNGKKPQIVPLLVHTGRYDGADSVRVDATTPSGHMVSIFTLAEDQSFPRVSQLYESYEIAGRRVNTYAHFSESASSIPTPPNGTKLIFEHETDDTVAGAYVDYKIGGKDAWECDATSVTEADTEEAMKNASPKVIFQYDVIGPAVNVLDDMLINVIFADNAPCPVTGRIGGVSLRGLVMPLRK